MGIMWNDDNLSIQWVSHLTPILSEKSLALKGLWTLIHHFYENFGIWIIRSARFWLWVISKKFDSLTWIFQTRQKFDLSKTVEFSLT